MSGAPIITNKPTPLAERTLIAALAAVWLLALCIVAALVLPSWPDAVAPQRIEFLGRALLGALLVIGLLIAIFGTPWCGTVRLAAMGAEVDVGERGDEHEQP